MVFKAPEGFTPRKPSGYTYRGFTIVHFEGRDMFGFRVRLKTWDLTIGGRDLVVDTLTHAKTIIDYHLDKSGK